MATLPSPAAGGPPLPEGGAGGVPLTYAQCVQANGMLQKLLDMVTDTSEEERELREIERIQNLFRDTLHQKQREAEEQLIASKAQIQENEEQIAQLTEALALSQTQFVHHKIDGVARVGLREMEDDKEQVEALKSRLRDVGMDYRAVYLKRARLQEEKVKLHKQSEEEIRQLKATYIFFEGSLKLRWTKTTADTATGCLLPGGGDCENSGIVTVNLRENPVTTANWLFDKIGKFAINKDIPEEVL